MSTVEPGSLLGPLFMAWNHNVQGEKEYTETSYYVGKDLKIETLFSLHLKYLESQIERLKVAFHVFQLDKMRGINVASIHEGAWCHHTANKVGNII